MRALLGSDLECEALKDSLEKFSKKAPRALRFHRHKGLNLKDIFQSQSFQVLGQVPWEESGYFADLDHVESLATHPAIGAGLAFIQEPGAMEAVNFLDPQPGDFVLDLSAAPGAKATQIGERLAGKGWLFANDPVKARAERLELLLSRHGIFNSSVYSLDGGNLAERFPKAFDRVLLDAPCSGESLFAKRNDSRVDIRNVDVQGCARRQFKILEFAGELLKEGGSLVYSTCSYSREENEGVVEGFLQNNPDFELIKSQRRFPHRDQVAGGYTALLKRQGEAQVGTKFSKKSLENTAGLIRHGSYRWNGERDLYLEAMNVFSNSKKEFEQLPGSPFREAIESWSDRVFVGDVELNDKMARDFLKGLALVDSRFVSVEKGFYRVTWRGYPMGFVKVVGERANNALPKILRGIESSL